MTEQLPGRKRPKGLQRLFFRAPIWLYRLGLGSLLGQRFLMLNHVGRKSGLPRQAVVEVARYDQETDTFLVASGFGPRSDWYRNLQKTPETTVQVGRRKLSVRAHFLSPKQSGEEMVRYARTYPSAARVLAQRVLGYEVDESKESYRALGEQSIPFVALEPQQQET
jgi:deazaflavin-dependent oxidoreductase (nitroreductase family)